VLGDAYVTLFSDGVRTLGIRPLNKRSSPTRGGFTCRCLWYNMWTGSCAS